MLKECCFPPSHSHSLSHLTASPLVCLKIKRLASQTKTAKSSGSEGGWLLLTALLFFVSFSFCFFSLFLFISVGCLLQCWGLRGVARHQAYVDGVLLCVSPCPFDLRQIALISPGPAFICLWHTTPSIAVCVCVCIRM